LEQAETGRQVGHKHTGFRGRKYRGELAGWTGRKDIFDKSMVG
jgi:hypothetical protein